MSKQVCLGFGQHASVQHRAPWEGRNSLYPWFGTFYTEAEQ